MFCSPGGAARGTKVVRLSCQACHAPGLKGLKGKEEWHEVEHDHKKGVVCATNTKAFIVQEDRIRSRAWKRSNGMIATFM